MLPTSPIMKFSAKASSAVSHQHCPALANVSKNTDSYYTVHFQPGWIHGEMNSGTVNRLQVNAEWKTTCQS